MAGGDDLGVHPADIDRLGNLLEYEPPGLYPQTPDQVAAHLDTLTVPASSQRDAPDTARTWPTAAAVTALTSLNDNSIFSPPFTTPTDPQLKDSTELTDDEVHKLTLGVDKQARARWRDIEDTAIPRRVTKPPRR